MKNFDKLTRIFSVLICVALVACIASTVMMFVFDVRSDIYTAHKTDYGSDARLRPTYDYGDVYINQTVFFVDSAMSGITEFEIIKDKSGIVTGRRGDMPLDFNVSTAETNIKTQDGRVQSIVDIVQEQQPQYLLISIGISNGVEHCSEEKFKQYYTRLIEAVSASSPQTKIILQSVFPVSKDVSASTPSISNNKIDEANKWIEELCTSLSLRYLHTCEVLKDDKGNLMPEYDSGDGMHLNEKGYATVINYIKTHGYR